MLTATHKINSCCNGSHISAHPDLNKAICQVTNGHLKEATLYCDYSFTDSEFPQCKIHKVSLPSSSDAKTSDVFFKITPLELENKKLHDNIQGCRIAFCDRSSKSLKSFGFQFASQDIYKIEGKTFSILQKLVAPSFGGKKALALIKNTTDSLGIPSLYVSDGSLLSTNKCCKESSLISLKLFEIFKYGQTWYEKQGAIPASGYKGINYSTFQYLNEYLEKFLDLKLYNQEYLRNHYLELLEMTQAECNEAFSKSKTYLYNLTIENLLSSFKKYKKHPVLKEIYFNTLRAAEATNTSHSKRVGELLDRLLEVTDKSQEFHALKHSFLESIVSFNYKHLLAFYQEKLQKPKSIKEVFLSSTLSLVFLEHFLGYFFDLTIPYNKEVNASKDVVIDFVTECFLKENQDLKNYLDKKVKTKATYLPQKAANSWKTQENDFMDAYYFENNYEENLQNILSQIFLGPKNFDITYFILLLFNQLRSIKVSQIETWAPSFTTKLNKLIGEKIFIPGSNHTLEHFIKKVQDQPETLQKAMGSMLDYFMQSAKFLPIHQISELREDESSMEHFFLAKICAFSLGPFEFQFDQESA